MTASENVSPFPQRSRTPRDDIWDSLTAHFGEPRTKTERSMVGRVVSELLEAGATSQETENACGYVCANFDSPSVNAVTKWFTVAQNGNGHRRSSQEEAIAQLRMQP